MVVIVGLCLVLLLAIPFHSTPCNCELTEHTPNGPQNGKAGDQPVIRVRSIEITSSRIEVEIASTILVGPDWMGDTNEKTEGLNSTLTYGPSYISMPFKGEPSKFTVWEHTRLEKDVFITTTGVARLDHTMNFDGNQVELKIWANGKTLSVRIYLLWGDDNVDVSLLPVVLQIPPATVHFEEGEEIKVTWSVAVKGQAMEAEWYFFNGTEETLIIYSTQNLGRDEKEGIETTSENTEDETTGRNTTEIKLSITTTDPKSVSGYYNSLLYDWDYRTEIYASIDVLSRGVMSTVPEGDVRLHTSVQTAMHYNEIPAKAYGVNKDEDAIITCRAMGYPVDAVKILGPNLEAAYTVTQAYGGFTITKMYLRDVQEADAGTYVCVASSYNRAFKQEMEVVLAEPLVIRLELVSQTEDKVVLRCTSRGHPVPSLTFSRPDNNYDYVDVEIQDVGIYDIKMTSDEEAHEVSAVLTISGNIADFGSFQCTGRNEIHEVHDWINI